MFNGTNVNGIYYTSVPQQCMFFKNMKCPFCRCSNNFILLSLPPPCSYKESWLNQKGCQKIRNASVDSIQDLSQSHSSDGSGYPQLSWCKQTAFKELNKCGRAAVNRTNCLPVYNWRTLQGQVVIGDHTRTTKGIRCRQNICLHSWTARQVQVGKAIVFSIRRLRSSP